MVTVYMYTVYIYTYINDNRYTLKYYICILKYKYTYIYVYIYVYLYTHIYEKLDTCMNKNTMRMDMCTHEWQIPAI
jgi:hypothetical protein